MTAGRPAHPGVPDDFPFEAVPYSLSGTQPKLAMTEENGVYYAEGTAPSEILQAYEVCEDLANQFMKYCLDKESAKFGTRQEILLRVHERLLQKDWCTKLQCGWVIRRTAQLLDWQFPKL